MFNKAIYQNRRKRLKEIINDGLVLLPGNDLMAMNYPDNHFHFRQDSSFLYYFGLDHPGMIGIIDIDNDNDILFGKKPTMEDVIWSGDQPTLDELGNSVGVINTKEVTDLKSVIETAQNHKRKIHFLPTYQGGQQIKLSNWLKINVGEVEQGVSIDLIKAVISQRSFKSEEEVVELDKAVDITADMHLTAMRQAVAGKTEMEITGAIHGVAVSGGGELSFPIILTINGQTLHNHYHGNTLKDGQLLLVDAGAEATSRYAGDMTRTFPVSGKFTQKQKEVYQIVLDAQSLVIGKMQPGVSFLDIHLHACKIIANGLMELGLMKGDVDEAVNQGVHALFMPHGLGHMMGLDVHDMEGLGEDYVGYTDTLKRSDQFGLVSLRLAKELETGFVVTNEPGIYFIPKLIDKWKIQGLQTDFINYDKLEEYKDFGGIRIEEDFLITEDGCRRLGKPVPKTIEDVESLRQESLA